MDKPYSPFAIMARACPKKPLPLLFKPFYRVDDSRGTITGGMGLGLAIVRNAVAVHGGTVMARNVTPHGSGS